MMIESLKNENLIDKERLLMKKNMQIYIIQKDETIIYCLLRESWAYFITYEYDGKLETIVYAVSVGNTVFKPHG